MSWPHTLNLCHAVHILSSLSVRANADSGKAPLDCILEIGIEADLGKVAPANVCAVEVTDIRWRLVTLVILGRRLSPFDLALAVSIAVRSVGRRAVVSRVATRIDSGLSGFALLACSLVIVKCRALLGFGLAALPHAIVEIVVCLALVVAPSLLAGGSQGALELKVLLSASDVGCSFCQNLFALDFRKAEDVCLVGGGSELALDGVQRRLVVGHFALSVNF